MAGAPSKDRSYYVRFAIATVVALICIANASAPATPSSITTRALVSLIDDIWLRRDQVGGVETMVDLGRRSLSMDPGNYEPTWRIARALWWAGATADDATEKLRSLEKAVQWAQGAITIDDRRVEGHFYYAIAVGEYGNSIGVAKAIVEGVAEKFEKAAQAAHAIDADFADGGPMGALGRYYAVLPWPMRNLERSRAFLENLRKRHPTNLMGRVFLADTYRHLGQHQAARHELEIVASTEELPDIFPGRSPVVEARERLREWSADEEDK